MSNLLATSTFPESNTSLESKYCNGFEIGLGNADVFVVVQQNGQKLLLLNMSYTVAKSLAQGLATAISALEEKTGNKIMTTDDIFEFLSKPKESKK